MDQQQWRSPAGEPEVLPPGRMPEEMGYRYYEEPGPAPVRRRSGWQLAPATYILTGINVAVFLLMVMSGVSAVAPSTSQLVYHWGANVGALVVYDHQWWRLVTATFVHSGIIHIATNMWCLYNLGLLGEPLLGSVGVFAVYLLTGVTGSLLSVALHPGTVSGSVITDPGIISVGASGAVFGLAGVLIPLLGSRLLPVNPAEVARLRRSVIYFAVLNFVIDFGVNGFHSLVRIDNMAHLGGFFSGLAMGVVLVPKMGAERGLWIRRQWLAYGGLLLLLLLAGHFVATLYTR
jgi:rhomboid protease GluP